MALGTQASAGRCNPIRRWAWCLHTACSPSDDGTFCWVLLRIRRTWELPQLSSCGTCRPAAQRVSCCLRHPLDGLAPQLRFPHGAAVLNQITAPLFAFGPLGYTLHVVQKVFVPLGVFWQVAACTTRLPDRACLFHSAFLPDLLAAFHAHSAVRFKCVRFLSLDDVATSGTQCSGNPIHRS